jgi:hypothetical protein
MKKIFTQLRRYSLALSALLLSGSLSAFADTEYTNYTESFDNIDTSVKGFTPQYWGHYVYTLYTGSYTPYTSSESGGYKNGYISAGAQVTLYQPDCLITPLVKGAISFYVKQDDSSTGKLKLYSYTRNGATYVKGDEISLPTDFTLSTEWQKLELTNDDYAYIGIMLNNASIDEFSAEQMKVIDLSAFDIVGYKVNNEKNVYADKEGKAQVSVSIQIKNTGSVTLTPGMENYSVTFYQKPSYGVTRTITVKDIDVTLKPGETSDSIEITGYYQLTNPAVSETYKYLYVCDNFFNNETSSTSINVISLAAKLNIYSGSSTTAFTSSTVQDYGLVKGSKDVEFQVRNTGGSTLKVKNVTFDDGLEGCSIDTPIPFTVEAGEENQKTIKIKMAGEEGTRSGNVTFTYENNVNDEDLTFQFGIKGGVADADSYTEDFEAGKFSGGWINQPCADDGKTRWSVYSISSTEGYCARHSTSTYPTKLITPKLHVEAGKTLSLSGRNYGGSTESTLTVYYSADRVNWTQLGIIQKTVPEESRVSNLYAWGETSYVFQWYTFNKVPEGDWYFAFEGAYCDIDNIFGFKLADVDYDLYIDSFSAKEPKGVVNYPASATVKVENLLGKAVSANDYSAALYADGTKVADGKTVNIDAFGTADVVFSFVPHTAGNITLKATVTCNNVTLESDEATVTINAESADRDVTVKADDANISYTSYSTLYGGDKNAFSEFIIPASYIDIPAGTTITKLSILGYNNGWNASCSSAIKIALAASDSLEFAEDHTYTAPDEANVVFTNDEYIIYKGGSAAAPETYTFTFDKPYTYTGGNLHVWFERSTSSYTYLYFAHYTDARTYSCSYKAYDMTTYIVNKTDNSMPVVVLSYPMAVAEVIGNVVADGAAVAGAKVTLSTEADVVYSGVTAEDGTFDIPVIQSGQDFTLTVTAEGYPTYTATVTVGSENLKVGTIDLTKGTSSIADVAAESAAKIIVNGNNLSIVADANAAVYTLDGKTVYNAYVDGEAQLTLTKGIYVVVINSANESKSYKIAIR